MKIKHFVFLLCCSLALVFTACKNKVEVSVFNNSEIDRINETVELCLCEFKDYDFSKLVVVDPDGKQVPYQLLYKGAEKPQALAFQVTIPAGKEKIYVIKQGVPENFPAKTYAHFVPQRKDDLSWENDKVAFRMYGPKLAPENPSNGVDVWFKRTTALITDKWYNDELTGKRSYHEDAGEGLDCYKVAHTLGAGGVCPYSNDTLWVYNQFDRYKILDNGPVRTSFILFWDKVRYKNKILKAQCIVTLDAGSCLNEFRIRYTGDVPDMQLAAGIFLHDSIQSIHADLKTHTIGYAENHVTETLPHKPAGRGYIGIVFPGDWLKYQQISQHAAGIVNYQMGDEFVYYSGAGWSKSGFSSDQEWFTYLNARKEALMNPLKIKLLE